MSNEHAYGSDSPGREFHHDGNADDDDDDDDEDRPSDKLCFMHGVYKLYMIFFIKIGIIHLKFVVALSLKFLLLTRFVSVSGFPNIVR